MQIDFVFFEGCPRAATARGRLRAALAGVGQPPTWTEWDSESPSTPDRLRGFASPTILIDGVDVEGKTPMSGSGCAVGGGPSEQTLRDVLRRAVQ
jgi:hypothetical protein